MNIHGKKILLGITGGIAAYKACELLRILQKRGAEVRVVMTREAAKFVGETTFAALSNFPVYVETATADSKPFQHIDYPRWADIYIVAPCSATSLARFAIGTGEEPVSLCFLAMQGEKWVVPAMNSVMYKAAAVQRNLETLKSWGVKVIEPACGYLACGEEGMGKFPEPLDIADAIEFSGSKTQTLLISIGRTEEEIDPVRYISNRSSGKTGAAIAREFLRNGWRVIAVCGKMEATLPKQCEIVPVQSAESMNKAVLKMQPQANVIVHCAAVADYSPKTASSQKIKNSKTVKNLELKENPNILKNTIKNKAKNQKIIAFALETENSLKNAQKKLKESNADILIVNTPTSGKGGFNKDTVEFGFLTPKKLNTTLTHNTKEALASTLLELIK
ncbi:MAG: bifunctional phosphopantothenoylcysteine decarboxylase/phosphopantothenate--cysteine ligase CoaBC [Fibromonadaceae bacterium]|jgi:phosphopantothenoylcysteine decarboxylase/phosphopantothenate--cysteine ligase|nr:bifunctional phosphopantothenoylcysteine decarboxylase/phosphopantothenate--cysteine ligase CoaBC [Fibromonadaceae bacterium]